MDYKLRWSDESIRNLEEVLADISRKWTLKEVDNFKNKLKLQLQMIISHPHMFPRSQSNPKLRKAVLSKQTTIFYEIKYDTISIIHIHLNKKRA